MVYIYIYFFSMGVPYMTDCVPGTPWLKCSSCGCGDYFLAQGGISGNH